RGGIVIDERCATSDPDVFAIGECALYGNRTYGLVGPGYAMAEVAADAIAGGDARRFTGADMSTKLKLLGVDVASFGDAFGATCNAIATQALSTTAAVKSCTKAGTGCGSCVTLVTQLLNKELMRAGVAVVNHLCEHFPHSRQELYHLTRVNRLRTFDEILERHGRGHGCEICKPAVASILAVAWNEHVLDDKLLPLQDTNDRFLANIQKDGTYSVVPRVPG